MLSSNALGSFEITESMKVVRTALIARGHVTAHYAMRGENQVELDRGQSCRARGSSYFMI